jgi:hypothetical protein
MVPYICFGHYMTIIRGIYIYIYIYVCTSLRAVNFCCLIYGCIIDVVMHWEFFVYTALLWV